MATQKEILSKLDAYDIIVKWIAALRSGEYKQGKTCLKSKDPDTGEYRYCCLGVLYEVCGIESRLINDPDYDNVSVYKYGKEEGHISRLMSRKFKMTTGTEIDTIYCPSTYYPAFDLISINDYSDRSGKKIFNLIANIIEKEILPKFEKKDS